jgi:hypothetical protein
MKKSFGARKDLIFWKKNEEKLCFVQDFVSELWMKHASHLVTNHCWYVKLKCAYFSDPVKNIDQLSRYVRSTKMWPAPLALFRELLDNLQVWIFQLREERKNWDVGWVFRGVNFTKKITSQNSDFSLCPTIYVEFLFVLRFKPTIVHESVLLTMFPQCEWDNATVSTVIENSLETPLSDQAFVSVLAFSFCFGVLNISTFPGKGHVV